MARTLGAKTGPHYHCEADKEYWKELKKRFATKIPSICYKRTTSQFGDQMWIIEGRASTRGHLDKSLCYSKSTANGNHNTCNSRIRGFRALDICSSYGISSRAFLTHHHSVDVVEPEEFMASLVECNSRIWNLTDRMYVQRTSDFSSIKFNSYDSIRIGTPQLTYILDEYPDIFNIKNIVLDFQLDYGKKQAIYSRGYVDLLQYTHMDSFTRA